MSIRARVQASLADLPMAVLAISGGLDSMALLDAAAATMPRGRLLVATFDHRTGPHAARAVALVCQRAADLGLPAVAGRRDMGRGADNSEAAWRAARWAFLNDVAARTGGTVVTAHTRDDQVETVLMRIMRGAGARGIAGLYAEGAVRRPLLDTPRSVVASYAAAHAIVWLDDPSNRSRRYFRNRLRLDLLPALRAVNPAFDEMLLDLARRAAAWRAELDAVLDRAIRADVGDGGLDVAIESLDGYSRESLSILWPALAGRAGIALDRRGTRRVVEFTINSRVGGRIQLAGGWEVARTRDRLELRRRREGVAAPAAGVLQGETDWGEWRFRPVARAAATDPWAASLPEGVRLTVRRWEPGDSMTVRAGEPARRVKRFLSDAGISGRRREEWPVVLADDRIIWIPGVCRSHAATVRSGRPGRLYRCDILDR